MNLPTSSNLPIEHLAGSFSNVTNSYKYYWFLAILQHLREHDTQIIPVNDLLARMVAEAWYPAQYFRLSFGKQDKLGEYILQLPTQGQLTAESKRSDVLESVRRDLDQKTDIGRKISSLGNYVPYRFLRAFFTSEISGVRDWKINSTVEVMAEESFSRSDKPCLYRLVRNPQQALQIQIHPLWLNYLRQHTAILTGFCLWHLVNYLQKNNPNVPNIPGKLFEPQQRNLTQARAFWNTILQAKSQLTCIYSGQIMTKGHFSLDHFLPWRFVAHDLIWNIIPTPRGINSSKSNNLPDLSLYFKPFSKLQHEAVQIATRNPHATRLLEDHILLFKISSIADLQTMSYQTFHDALYQIIAPQVQIAVNMGFISGWKHNP